MKHKALFWGLFLMILACKKDQRPATFLWEFIPRDAALIVKIDDYAALRENLGENSFLSGFKDSEAYLSILEKVDGLKSLRPTAVSLLTFTEVDNQWEYTFTTDFHKNLIILDSIGNKKVESMTMDKNEVQAYTLDNSTFYTVLYDKKIVLSSSLSLLQDLMGSLGSFAISGSLKKLLFNSDGTKQASIFVDLTRTDTVFSTVLKENPAFDISQFSDWCALDLDLNSENLHLRGISMAKDSTERFLQLFKHTDPLQNTIQKFAPSDATSVLSYTFDDFMAFARNRSAYLNLPAPNDSLFATVEEIGIIQLASKKAVLLNTYGSETVLEYLKSISPRSFDFRGNEILELEKTDFLEKSFSPIIQDFVANYVSPLDNAFLFAREKGILEHVIRNYKNGTTWERTETFQSAMGGMASESSLLYLANFDGMSDVAGRNLSASYSKGISSSQHLKYVYGTQIIADQDIFHTNTFVQKIVDKKLTGGITKVFSVAIDDELATSPQFVIDHRTKSKEIVVQDVDNVLYLISRKGNILWKKKLNGRIQGKIHQVDLYKNGRLQLAFTTSDQFLVLDRNGKEVKPFTLSYKGANLNPLAVFDYDGTRDYRFVVTHDEKVHMYNNAGKIVTGFTYTKAKKPILRAPKHFRLGNRDYLLFQLVDGSLKILDRVGRIRIPVKKKIDFSDNGIYAYKNRFIATDKKGILYQIDQKGKISEANLNMGQGHGMEATSKTLVLMDNNLLNVKGHKVELDLGVYLPPRIYYLNDKIYVCVADIQNQRIHLFDSNAKPIPNFPVLGSSMADMANIVLNGRPALIAKDTDNSLVLYQLD
ncbi:MAG: ribonuclease HII [Bacteroidota bacterium]